MRNVIKSIDAQFPSVRRASLRVSLQSYSDSLRTVLLDSFVRFTRFFFSFLRLTHRPPPSNQRVSNPHPFPSPSPHSLLPLTKSCNSSHILAVVPLSPAFLRPSHAAELPPLTQGPTRRLCCSALELSELRETTPPSGQALT
ncbi:hypothetical protein CRENBAI_016050 [Crenichthys baileyi]|uniref:Uncharacterized protein n=1 Tax=Crenichthys baileyi TaxID=28760 RepID=A0AAV9RR89_9TELE